MTEWTKREALTKPAPSYDNFGCGYRPVTLNLRRRLIVGFGSVVVRRDSETVWQGDHGGLTIQKFERMAQTDPDHDWQVEWIGPMRGETYQRHGKNEWNLVEWNEGFA